MFVLKGVILANKFPDELFSRINDFGSPPTKETRYNEITGNCAILSNVFLTFFVNRKSSVFLRLMMVM